MDLLLSSPLVSGLNPSQILAFPIQGFLFASLNFIILFGILGWFEGFLRQDGREPPDRGGEYLELKKRYADLEAQLERFSSLLQMTTSLTAAMSYERVLVATLDLASSAVSEGENRGSRLVSFLLLFNNGNDRLCVASSRGLAHADTRVEFPATSGVLERALSTCQIEGTEDPSGDPELRKLAALQPCSQAVCIPLSVGLEVYGLMVFAHPQAGFFTQERLGLLDLIAQQAIVALKNARLYRDLQQEKERMMEIQEEARNKLARDLHDGPTQSIGAIAMRVNFARRLMERDPKAAAEELFKIEELSRRTSKEIRQMLFTLRPLVIESEGLVAGLKHLASKTGDTHGQKVTVEADPACAADMEIGKQGVAFFIAEEAVNNARKHAQADNIFIRLNREADLLLMEIEDDGLGFDLAEVEADYRSRGSLGMINLRERAELISGILKIESAPGQGTRVRVIIPLSIEAADRIHRPGFSG